MSRLSRSADVTGRHIKALEAEYGRNRWYSEMRSHPFTGETFLFCKAEYSITNFIKTIKKKTGKEYTHVSEGINGPQLC